jgi:hypothetical protein
MSSTAQQSRQPAGTPAGGEFGSKTHGEADVTLDPAAGATGPDPRFSRSSDDTDPRAVLVGDGFTDADGTRWTRCSDCQTTVYAPKGSNEWSEDGTDDTECSPMGPTCTTGVHKPDERIAITEVAHATEKVASIRSEIAAMAASDPEDSRIGSVKLNDAVQRLAEAEIEADLWDRVQVRLDEYPAEFPTVNAAIESVYEQGLTEIMEVGAGDTYSGRGNDLRRVRFDAERSWLSRRRLQGQVADRSAAA